jgi:hypothetical protein
MPYEDSVSYFKRLEPKGPSPASLPVDNQKSVISSVGKSSNMRCHYCDKKNHNTADYRAITKFKQQKKDYFEAKARPGKRTLAFLFQR